MRDVFFQWLLRFYLRLRQVGQPQKIWLVEQWGIPPMSDEQVRAFEQYFNEKTFTFTAASQSFRPFRVEPDIEDES